MNSKITLKLAVSGLAVGATMVACSPSAVAKRPSTASTTVAKSEQQAVNSYARAQAAVRDGTFAEALPHAERAVELSPRDVGYRMLLADLYMKNGRFRSAETTFGDVLKLEPANVRASLSIALVRIGLGETSSALAELDRLSSTAPAGDIGLAYALAGQPQRALELLEPAARAPGATGRVRQNLALAYAIAGDWQKARTTAAQDVSPAELGKRLQHWASFAQPSAPHAQVAAMLGATPGEDSGQPVRLALADPGTTAFAAADPAPEPSAEAAPVAAAALAAAPEPEPAAEPQPVQTAAAEMPQWVSEAVPASSTATPEPSSTPLPAEETRPVYAEAVKALVTPQPSILKPSRTPLASRLSSLEEPRRQPKVQAQRSAGAGRFAVQLGAFASAAAVERAWAGAYKRYGFAGHSPLSTTVKLPRGTFHRLSVAGFASHAEASAVCRTVRAKGGACFVRAVAGDAPVQWASRYGFSRRG